MSQIVFGLNSKTAENSILPCNSISNDQIAHFGKISAIVANKEGRSRMANPQIHVGLCGEQGNQEETVRICHELGFRSISCNPSKIPQVLYYAAKAQLYNPK